MFGERNFTSQSSSRPPLLGPTTSRPSLAVPPATLPSPSPPSPGTLGLWPLLPPRQCQGRYLPARPHAHSRLGPGTGGGSEASFPEPCGPWLGSPALVPGLSGHGRLQARCPFPSAADVECLLWRGWAELETGHLLMPLTRTWPLLLPASCLGNPFGSLHSLCLSRPVPWLGTSTLLPTGLTASCSSLGPQVS